MALIGNIRTPKVLATAIVEAARRLKIAEADQPMTGPVVMMLLNDIEGMATNVHRRSFVRQALTKDVVAEVVRKSDAYFRDRQSFPNDQAFRNAVEHIVDAICGKQDLSIVHYAKSYSVGPVCHPDVDRACMTKRFADITCHDCRAIETKRRETRLA